MKRRLHAEPLEARRLLAADIMYLSNPIDRLDVNNDRDVTPLDAVVLVNALNIEADGGVANVSAFLDVNLDQDLTPSDALTVFNFLNGGGRGAVEELQQVLDVNEGNVPEPFQAVTDQARELLVEFDSDRQLLQEQLDLVLDLVGTDPQSGLQQLDRVEFASHMTAEVLSMSLDALDDDLDGSGGDPGGGDPGLEFLGDYRDAVEQVVMELDAGEMFETLYDDVIVGFVGTPGEDDGDLPSVFDGDYDQAIEVRQFLAAINQALEDVGHELTPEQQEILERYIENPDQVEPEVLHMLCVIMDQAYVGELTRTIQERPMDVNIPSLISALGDGTNNSPILAPGDGTNDAPAPLPEDPVAAAETSQFLQDVFTALEQEGIEPTPELLAIVNEYRDQPEELMPRVTHELCVIFDQQYRNQLAEMADQEDIGDDLGSLFNLYGLDHSGRPEGY